MLNWWIDRWNWLFAFLQEHCSKSNWLASIVLMVSGWQAASLTTSRLHSYIPLDIFYIFLCFLLWVLSVYVENIIFSSANPLQVCLTWTANRALPLLLAEVRDYCLQFPSLGELKLRTQIFKNRQPGWLPAKMLQEAFRSVGRFTLLVDVFLSSQDWAWCLRKHPRHISHALKCVSINRIWELM